MTETATRFVHVFGSDDDFRVFVSSRSGKALAAGSWGATDHADCGKFGDAFGNREKARHWSEWLTTEVEIEAGYDNAYAAISEFLSDVDDGFVEELGFVDAYDAGVVFDMVEDFASRLDGARQDLVGIVALHVLGAITVINRGLKDLNLLASNLSALQTADEFLRLTAEHASANDLDEARQALMKHLVLPPDDELSFVASHIRTDLTTVGFHFLDRSPAHSYQGGL